MPGGVMVSTAAARVTVSLVNSSVNMLAKPDRMWIRVFRFVAESYTNDVWLRSKRGDY